jgi:hypothetical protein
MGLVARQVEDYQAIQSILCCASITTTHIPVISLAVKPKKAPIAMLKAKKAPVPSKKPAKSRKEVPDIVAIEEEGWEEVVTQNEEDGKLSYQRDSNN